MSERRLSKQKSENIQEAEYILIKTLESLDEESDFDEIKREIDNLSIQLESKGINSPIQFAPVHGPSERHSRAFLKALNRCRDLNAVHKDKNKIQLTDLANEFANRLEDKLSENFVSIVEEEIGSERKHSS